MPRRPTFPRRGDLIRAYKASRDAGVPNPVLVIDHQNKTLTIKAGDPVIGGTGAPLDQWMAKHADQTEGH